MGERRPIGVFDSGLGGLTVVKELCRYLPNENIVYFGDTGRVPYGTRSRETIKRYAAEDEKFLIAKDVKLIIAACGTVSSVAEDTAKDLPVPFFEVVSHAAKAAAEATRNGKIGILGTAATVKSGKHAEYILKYLKDAQITAQACTMFVPLVEEGWYSSDDIVVLETVRRYLQPLIDAQVDTIILGCTHFPVLSEAIKKIMGDDVVLIDAGTATSAAVLEFLQENEMLNDSKSVGEINFYVSDKPDSFRDIASVLLGEKIEEERVEQVNLNGL